MLLLAGFGEGGIADQLVEEVVGGGLLWVPADNLVYCIRRSMGRLVAVLFDGVAEFLRVVDRVA